MGKKREGTIAAKGANINQLTSNEIDILLKNYKSTPYRDISLNCTPGEILSDRIARLKESRVKRDLQALL